MRITNNIIRENALIHMRRSYQQMEEAQERVSTGIRLRHASDDPGAAGTAITTRSSLRAIDQYRRAIDWGNVRIRAEEDVLMQLSDLLARVKELTSAEVSAGSNDTTRTAARKEIQELLSHVVGLANTQVGDAYLFGGNDASTPPFALDLSGPTPTFTSTSPSGEPAIEIGHRQWTPTAHNGTEVFGTATSGALKDMVTIVAALQTGDNAPLLATLPELDATMDRLEDLIIETGVRANHLELTSSNLDAVENQLMTLKSSLEEVDIEEAVSDLIGRQTAYQAAMLATSRVMGLTLTDYLR